jgi:D-lactate dehydrogenase (cytochrome)
MQISPGKAGIATDVCVPISRLAECVARNNDMIEELDLVGLVVGHVGDGNFHTTILVDMADKDEVSRAEEFVGRLNDLAISMDGTCTGEHGIGQGKRPYLTRELGAATDVMASIKAALDPDGIFNPGKILST